MATSSRIAGRLRSADPKRVRARPLRRPDVREARAPALCAGTTWQYAVDDPTSCLRSSDPVTGTVYLVGAGPGAPDLLTLRAARLLERADIVFYDALVHPGTLALATRARLIDVGKRYGKISTEQRFINRALIEAARTHAIVVRLKGGD